MHGQSQPLESPCWEPTALEYACGAWMGPHLEREILVLNLSAQDRVSRTILRKQELIKKSFYAPRLNSCSHWVNVVIVPSSSTTLRFQGLFTTSPTPNPQVHVCLLTTTLAANFLPVLPWPSCTRSLPKANYWFWYRSCSLLWSISSKCCPNPALAASLSDRVTLLQPTTCGSATRGVTSNGISNDL